MPNGKPGDHPYTDIVVHGRRVYSAAADALVREIAAIADGRTRRELVEMLLFRFNEYDGPDVALLERELTWLRDELRRAEDGRNEG